jgi:flagellar biosynthesis/type III secretory pathway protein FliH
MMALDERPGLGGPAITPDDLAALVGELAALHAERDQLRALALEQSGALDQALAARLTEWADGYRAGFEAGREVGYRAGFEQAVTDWKITAADMPWLGGQTYAELDKLRYPPSGRLSWIILRPGEWCVHEAAGLLRCPDDCPGRQP